MGLNKIKEIMKKKKLNVNSLSLNKKTISNLNTELINGGKAKTISATITLPVCCPIQQSDFGVCVTGICDI